MEKEKDLLRCMKTYIKYFALMLLLQSCYSTRLTHKPETKARIITVDGSHYNFEELIMKDSTLYGIIKVDKGFIKQDLSNYDIKKIKYYNKETGKNLGILAIIALGIFIVTSPAEIDVYDLVF